MNHVSYRCSTPRYGAEGRTRTDDLLITSELLCQLSYSSMVRVTGLEPVCLAAVDFESTASADSAIPAYFERSEGASSCAIVNASRTGFEPVSPSTPLSVFAFP